jgi:hypothetical protein
LILLNFGIIRLAAEFVFGARFIRWLGTFVEDERGHTSAKRFALIFSVTVSGVGILWLVACRGVYLLEHEADIGLELAVLMLGASGSGALAYMFGKPTERTKEQKDNAPLSN